MSETRRLYGLDVDALTLAETVDLARDAIATHSRLLVGVVNAAKVVKLSRDDVLRESLLDADVLLADGQSVVWASHLLGRPLPERVAGIDLFESLLALADRDRRRVYLLGARPEVLARVEEQIRQRWPGVVIAGTRDGYFTEEESSAVAAEIVSARPDLLFLGMTTPKKEVFLGTYGRALGVPVMHGVGGSFDVLAGVTRRAPLLWQRLGLEWAYRVLQEPRRLWRRYLTTNAAFLAMSARELLHPRILYAAAPDRHDLTRLDIPRPRTATDPIADHAEEHTWTRSAGA